MTPDYDADYTVRKARLIGWSVTAVLAVSVLVAMAWKIAEVSEARTVEATREHLVSSLNTLAADRMASGHVLEERWKTTNPFVLLRWRQDNYCGELVSKEEARAGCWYWLPTERLLLYRARYGGDTDKARQSVYRLITVPGEWAGRKTQAGAFTLELEAVPVAR